MLLVKLFAGEGERCDEAAEKAMLARPDKGQHEVVVIAFRPGPGNRRGRGVVAASMKRLGWRKEKYCSGVALYSQSHGGNSLYLVSMRSCFGGRANTSFSTKEARVHAKFVAPLTALRSANVRAVRVCATQQDAGAAERVL